MSTFGKVDSYKYVPDTTQTTVQRKVDNPPANVEPTVPDLESPIPGFQLEKEQKVNRAATEEDGNPVEQKANVTEVEAEDNPVAQDDKDYIIPNPDGNIVSKKESIAIISDNIPPELSGATARLVDNTLYSDFYQKSKNDKLLEQGMSLVNHNDKRDFFDIVFPKTDKRFSINAELIGESAKMTNSNESADVSYVENSARAQTIGVYNDPKNKINALLFFSGTKTNTHIKAESLIDDVPLETRNTERTISLYGAFKKKCKKDEYSVGGLYYNDSLTRTGRIGGSYYLGKWFSSIGGYINWTKIAESNVINKSHIKIKFLQPKIELNDASSEEAISNQTDDNSGALQSNNSPKWKTSWSPTVDIRSVAGTEMTIVGTEFNAIKQKNATTHACAFMGASTTSDSSEDNQQSYNGNLALKFEYDKPLGANTTFKANVTINEQFTFPLKDNVFTTSASANYDSPKVSAYGNIKYTLVPDRSYFGAVLGVTGSITKSLDYFAEANHAILKEKWDSDNTTKFSSVMFGARLNF